MGNIRLAYSLDRMCERGEREGRGEKEKVESSFKLTQGYSMVSERVGEQGYAVHPKKFGYRILFVPPQKLEAD